MDLYSGTLTSAHRFSHELGDTFGPLDQRAVPDAHQDRVVISDFAAPTAKCAAMLTANATTTALNPPKKKNGIIGIKAPTAVDNAAERQEIHGFGK